jgi:hypothetical protein
MELIVDNKYMEMRRKISHLLYMDDWKLLDKSEDYLENELEIVKAISKDITMNFGV